MKAHFELEVDLFHCSIPAETELLNVKRHWPQQSHSLSQRTQANSHHHHQCHSTLAY